MILAKMPFGSRIKPTYGDLQTLSMQASCVLSAEIAAVHPVIHQNMYPYFKNF